MRAMAARTAWLGPRRLGTLSPGGRRVPLASPRPAQAAEHAGSGCLADRPAVSGSTFWGRRSCGNSVAADGAAAAASGHEAASTSRTRLGSYLERCGAVWGDAVDVHPVEASEEGRVFSWRVDLPREQLETIHQGEPLESPPFDIGNGHRGRFQLFPKGDVDCSAEGMCSLWLCTDAAERPPLRLMLGSVERKGGASQFCRLNEAIVDGVLEVSLHLETAPGATAEARPALPALSVQQSLQLTGLQAAEWQLFNVEDLRRAARLVTSPPFRFHHVLLGDMYLELLPGVPHPEHCTLFFRCRVPTMKLRVSLGVGGAFSKTFEAQGKSTCEEDLQAGRYLQVNLGAPGVVDAQGAIGVRCSLEEVVVIPSALRDMIPKLDERAHWPKRL